MRNGVKRGHARSGGPSGSCSTTTGGMVPCEIVSAKILSSLMSLDQPACGQKSPQFTHWWSRLHDFCFLLDDVNIIRESSSVSEMKKSLRYAYIQYIVNVYLYDNVLGRCLWCFYCTFYAVINCVHDKLLCVLLCIFLYGVAIDFIK